MTTKIIVTVCLIWALDIVCRAAEEANRRRFTEQRAVPSSPVIVGGILIVWSIAGLVIVALAYAASAW